MKTQLHAARRMQTGDLQTRRLVAQREPGEQVAVVWYVPALTNWKPQCLIGGQWNRIYLNKNRSKIRTNIKTTNEAVKWLGLTSFRHRLGYTDVAAEQVERGNDRSLVIRVKCHIWHFRQGMTLRRIIWHIVLHYYITTLHSEYTDQMCSIGTEINNTPQHIVTQF